MLIQYRVKNNYGRLDNIPVSPDAIEILKDIQSIAPDRKSIPDAVLTRRRAQGHTVEQVI